MLKVLGSITCEILEGKFPCDYKIIGEALFHSGLVAARNDYFSESSIERFSNLVYSEILTNSTPALSMIVDLENDINCYNITNHLMSLLMGLITGNQLNLDAIDQIAVLRK